MPDRPSWINDALVQLLKAAGSNADAPTLDAEASRVVGFWNGPAHNAKHLGHLFERLDELEPACTDIVFLKLSAAYRGNLPSDAVNLPAASLDKLAALQEPDNRDSQLLADAELSLLATAPQKYRKYVAALREEASGLSLQEFFQKRQQFLHEVLGRPRLFLTPFASKWGPQLRENLEGELAIIGSAGQQQSVPSRLSTAQKVGLLKDRRSEVCSRTRDFDDTSSLEDISDLFAHKKRQQER